MISFLMSWFTDLKIHCEDPCHDPCHETFNCDSLKNKITVAICLMKGQTVNLDPAKNFLKF